MRIAHVTDCFLPRMGGIERQVEGLAHAQAAFGHEIEIITSVPASSELAGSPTGRGAGARQQHDPVTVIRPEPRRGEPGDIRYSTMLSGRRAVLEGDYDLVHVHASTFSPMAYLAAGAASKSGVPTVITLHSLWSYATPIFRVADLPLGWRRWPVTWTAVSRVAAASLAPVLRSGTEISVLPNAVSPDLWHIPRLDRQRRDSEGSRGGNGDVQGDRPGPVVIVSVMRLAARKRPLPFLRMLREVRAKVPAHIRLEAKIIGDGPKREAVERYLKRHGMDSWVQLTGQLDQQGIREIFAQADLYASPATLESFGIAALEARSAGLPVVGFAHSGVSDFVADGHNGLLVDSDDEMAAAMVRLVTSPLLRSAMTLHNTHVESGFSWRNVLQICEEVYARAGAGARVAAHGAGRSEAASIGGVAAR
ncbi:glycosyltransferase family 4 protein [Jatrophihabitans sp. DSM 45814]